MEYEDGPYQQQYLCERHPENIGSAKDELQRLVAQTEMELSQLHDIAIANGHEGLLSQFDQLDMMSAAFDNSIVAESYLPFRQSALPAILALRHTHQIILQSHSILDDEQVSLDSLRHQLELDIAFLKGQETLSHAIQERIGSLRRFLHSTDTDLEPQSRGPLQKSRLLEAEKIQFDVQSSLLSHTTNQFIMNHLSNMLVMEDLGGPVVGEWADVNDELLAAGFRSQGKPRKSTERVKHDKLRQLRLDQVWSHVGSEYDRQASQHNDNETAAPAHISKETSAASHEMQVLLLALLNNTMEASNNASVYVQTKGESAAARFLVRAKVAQFHPRDATRLRLIDFGRELEN